MSDLKPCPFSVGDHVQRKPGSSYLFPSVVISIGLKLDGVTWHCECEGFLPGMEGMTHVFPASGLVPLDASRWAAAKDAEIARLREALVAVLPFVATQSVGCHGDKCREQWCRSCNGEDDAEIAAMAGMTAKMDARQALGASHDA